MPSTTAHKAPPIYSGWSSFALVVLSNVPNPRLLDTLRCESGRAMRPRTSTFAMLLAGSAWTQSGPQFHWPLDEIGGTIAYSTGGNANGTLAGGAGWAPQGGHHFGAVRLDGVDDRVLLGSCDITSGGPGLALSFWVKPDFVTGMERTLIAKTVGPQLADHIWSVAFVNGSSLRFRLRAGGNTTELSTGPSSLFGGTWYHVVASYDGSQMRVHLNGSLMASTAKAGAIGYHPQAPASIGATSTGSQPFSGWLDDVRIYDRSLSDAEILDLLLGQVAMNVAPVEDVRILDRSLFPPTGNWNELRVFDMAGRTMKAQRSVNGTDAIDLGSLPAGSYLVCLEGSGMRRVRPLFLP